MTATTNRADCGHADSLYGRCAACGMTWEQQAQEHARIHGGTSARIVNLDGRQVVEVTRHGYFIGDWSDPERMRRELPRHGVSTDPEEIMSALIESEGRRIHVPD
jgi:hypothetical protein